jgi:hypothetical protein
MGGVKTPASGAGVFVGVYQIELEHDRICPVLWIDNGAKEAFGSEIPKSAHNSSTVAKGHE